MYLDKKVTILLPTAGAGTRMGGNVRKQYLLLREKEILRWTLEHLNKISYWDELFVIVPSEDVVDVNEKISEWLFDTTRKIMVIPGGETRQQSVLNGLKASGNDTEYVIVHDGVRPFIPIVKTETALKKLIETPVLYGIIAGVKVTDTLKSVNLAEVIESTVDREKIWAVQTPQIFRYKELVDAHYSATQQNIAVTDDAALLETMGNSVGIFESDRSNIKITEPYDLILADVLIDRYMKSLEVLR